MQHLNTPFNSRKIHKSAQDHTEAAQKNQQSTTNMTENTIKKTQYKNLLEAEDYCLRAKQLLEKRQWGTAQVILQKGLLEVEKTAKAYHLLGLALYHQGFFQASLKELQRACGREKKPEYFLNLSIVLNELGRYTEAKKAYEKASHLGSQSQAQNWKEEVAERHHQTAKTYLKKNQFKSALREYIYGLQFYQKPEAQLQIARLLWKLNQKPVAEKYLKGFICLHPENIKARLLLAEWHFENKQIPQAINEWESILKMQPQNPEAHNCLLKMQRLL